MTDHKFTDDVIKALECCQTPIIADCIDCPNRASGDSCVNELMREALDLINRQKAEIESLKKIGDDKTSEILRHVTAIVELHKQLETAKSEAIKDFAQRLKQKGMPVTGGKGFEGVNMFASNILIDTLVKEMTEDLK